MPWTRHLFPAPHRHRTLALLVVFASIAAAPASVRAGIPTPSQADDPDANWQRGFQAPGMDGHVTAFCEYQGDLVVGGTFRTIGSQVISHVARWDGATWWPMGAGLNGDVHRLILYHGDLIAAGEMTAAGDLPVGHIARWDGTAWRALGAGLDSLVECMAVYRDTLFAGGRFTRVAGAPVDGIARWDGTDWIATDGLPEFSPGDAVHDLVVAGGHLYGNYWPLDANGDRSPTASPLVVEWNGAGWTPLPRYLSPEGMTALGDTLYVGGPMGLPPGGADGSDDISVARWSGTEWITLGRTWRSDVSTLVAHAGTLYLGQSNALFRWNGQDWDAASRPVSTELEALFSGRDGLYAGVDRLQSGPTVAHGLARWNGDGWQEVGDEPGLGFNLWESGRRQVLLAPAGEGFTAGGTFYRLGNLSALSLIRWDGVSWRTLPGGPSSFRANTFIDLNGRLTTAEDDPFGNGSNLRTLDNFRWLRTFWFPGRIRSLTPWRNRLVIAGDLPPGHIKMIPQVIIDPDEVPEVLGPGLDGAVTATCRMGSAIVASGEFTSTADGSVPLSHVGTWDGKQWIAMDQGIPRPAITLEPFAGGVAAAVDDGVLHWDGTHWLRLGQPFDGPVLALATYEGELLAGGEFTLAGETPVGHLARLHDGSWEPIGSGMNDPVQDLLVVDDQLWVSGAFTTAGAVPASGLAGWREVRATVESLHTHVEGDTVEVTWRDPESPSHRLSIARWSTDDYPSDPDDGQPLPFGEDGRFPATPGTVHSIRLGFPPTGLTAYFSVFAQHADGYYSAPRRTRALVPDLEPPRLVLEAVRGDGDPPLVQLTVRCDEALDTTRVEAWRDSTRLRLVRLDSRRMTWRGSAAISAESSSRLRTCARDSVGNEACREGWLASSMARPGVRGSCAAPGGRFQLEWTAGAFATTGPVTAIAGDDGGLPACEVSAPEGPRDPLLLTFRVPDGVPADGNAARLVVVQPDSSLQGGTYDPATRRLSIRTSTLGAYRLAIADHDFTTIADPHYLELSPAQPNPFRHRATLSFVLHARLPVRVTVHDVTGRTVATLFDRDAGPGPETVSWDGRWHSATGSGNGDGAVASGDPGRECPSGVYFARVQAGAVTRSIRLVRAR